MANWKWEFWGFIILSVIFGFISKDWMMAGLVLLCLILARGALKIAQEGAG